VSTGYEDMYSPGERAERAHRRAAYSAAVRGTRAASVIPPPACPLVVEPGHDHALCLDCCLYDAWAAEQLRRREARENGTDRAPGGLT
jgi:hypothetical protein